VVQKRFKFPEGSVELYAEKVANRGLCAIAQAESLRYKLLGGLAVRRCAARAAMRASRLSRMRTVRWGFARAANFRPCMLHTRRLPLARSRTHTRQQCTDAVTPLPLFPPRRSACYGVLRFVMESGAKGCEVIVSGKLRAQRAKSMKFKDGYMVSSGSPVNDYVDAAVRHVMLRQGVLGIKVKIMLEWDPTGKNGPKKPLPDMVTVHKPKDEETSAFCAQRARLRKCPWHKGITTDPNVPVPLHRSRQAVHRQGRVLERQRARCCAGGERRWRAAASRPPGDKSHDASARRSALRGRAPLCKGNTTRKNDTRARAEQGHTTGCVSAGHPSSSCPYSASRV
jgi:ribosomal protein S3